MAEELTRRFGLPLWRFANSGTEATMDAVHLMRAITGRDLIIKVEGCYHGHHDSVQVSVCPEADEVGPAHRPNQVPASTGIPKAITDLTLIVGFNDLDGVTRLLDEYPGQIAGMIVEPIMMNAGIILPEPGYLAGLKELLHARGALLAFDEVKTGLTAGPGRRDRDVRGHAGHHLPGQGHRRRSLRGRHRRHARGHGARGPGDYDMVGTFNGNPLAMAAARAMLCEVATPAAYERIEELRQQAVAGIEREIARNGLAAHVVSVGAKGCVVFSPEPVRDFRGFLRRRRLVQPGALAVPAQRRGVPAALGQERAVADLRAARHGGHRPPDGELRHVRGRPAVAAVAAGGPGGSSSRAS